MNLFDDNFFNNIGIPKESEPVDLVDSMNNLSIANNSKPIPFVHSRNVIIQNKSGNQKNNKGQSGRITSYKDAIFLVKVIEEIFVLFKDLPKQELNSDPFILFEKTTFHQVIDNKIKKISIDQNTKCKILDYIPSIFIIETKEKKTIQIPFNKILQVAFLGESKDKLALITSLEPLKASIFKFDYKSSEIKAAIKKQDYPKFQESVLKELSERMKSEPLGSIFGDYEKLISTEIDPKTVCFSFVYGDKKLIGEYGLLKDSTLPQWKIAVDRGQIFFNEKDLNFDNKDFVLIKIGDFSGKYGKLIEKTDAFAVVLLDISGRKVDVLEKDLFHKDLEYNGKFGQIIKYVGENVIVSMKTETGNSEETIPIANAEIFTENINMNSHKNYDTDYVSENLDEEKDIDSDNESIQSDKSQMENLAFQADHDSDYQEETEMKTSYGDSYDREIQNLTRKQKENQKMLDNILKHLKTNSYNIDYFEIINGMELIYKLFADEFSSHKISESVDGKIIKLAFIFSKLLKYTIPIDLEYTGARKFDIDYYIYILQKSKMISSKNLKTGILIKDNQEFKFKELKGKTEFGDYRILFNNAFIFLEHEYGSLELQTKVQDLPELVTLQKPIEIHNIPKLVVFSQLTDTLQIVPNQKIMWNKEQKKVIDNYIIYLEEKKQKAKLKNKNVEKYDYMIANIDNVFFVIKDLQSKKILSKIEKTNLENLLVVQKAIFEKINNIQL